MKFENETDRDMFLKGVPFFKTTECFCIGKTLEEAALVTRQALNFAEGKGRSDVKDVGLDIQRAENN